MLLDQGHDKTVRKFTTCSCWFWIRFAMRDGRSSLTCRLVASYPTWNISVLVFEALSRHILSLISKTLLHHLILSTLGLMDLKRILSLVWLTTANSVSIYYALIIWVWLSKCMRAASVYHHRLLSLHQVVEIPISSNSHALVGLQVCLTVESFPSHT